jgi:hypothetical protein
MWAKGIRMDTDSSEIIVGLMVAVFGLIGLFLIAGAADIEMYVFGLALTIFSVCFDFGLIKHHFDRRDRARRYASYGENHHV